MAAVGAQMYAGSSRLSTALATRVAGTSLMFLLFVIGSAAQVSAAWADVDSGFGDGGKTLINVSADLDFPQATVIDANGNLIVAGYTYFSGTAYGFVLRYDATGTLDPSFGNNGQICCLAGVHLSDVAVQADGKLLVTGYEANVMSPTSFVARYDAIGQPDLTFGNAGRVNFDFGGYSDKAIGVAIQSSGKIVVLGAYTADTDSSSLRAALIRLEPAGALDQTFANPVTTFGRTFGPEDLVVQADDKIVISGTVYGYGLQGHDGFVAVRYSADGVLDSGFGAQGIAMELPGESPSAAAVALQDDGKLLVAGTVAKFGFYDTYSRFAVVRFQPDGTVDTAFGTGGTVIVSFGTPWCHGYDVALGGAGRITLAGVCDGQFAVAALNSGGGLDTAFSGDGLLMVIPPDLLSGSSEGDVRSAIQGDGRILLVGANGDVVAVRLAGDGAIDTDYGDLGWHSINLGRGVDRAYAVAIQPDGRIVVAGNGASDAKIVRLLPTGEPDSTFGSGGAVTKSTEDSCNVIRALALQDDGKIVAAGSTEEWCMGAYRLVVARYLADGTPDLVFGVSGQVTVTIASGEPVIWAVAIQSDGKIVVAGRADADTGQDGFALARLQHDGSIDGSFGTGGQVFITVDGVYSEASTLLFQPDAKIVVGGTSDTNLLLIRLDSAGNLDGTFGNNGMVATPLNGHLQGGAVGLALQSEGRIIAAARVNGGANSNFALFRYLANGVLDTSFADQGVSITPMGVGATSEHVNVIVSEQDQIIAAGTVLGASYNDARLGLAFYDSDGVLDTALGSGGKLITNFGGGDYHAFDATPYPGNKLVVAGDANVGLGADFLVARFAYDAELRPVSVTRAGTGNGTVTSTPAGVECGQNCTANFAAGSVVTLTATADVHSVLAGWSGACTGILPCMLTLDAARSVTATFMLQSFPLSVSRAGAGSGAVSSTPAGIDCGSTCSVSFDYGTMITLTAIPGSFSAFAGWSGACRGAEPCTVAMTSTAAVTATFVPVVFTVTVDKTGLGTGRVTSTPAGIDCGSTCSAPFAGGQTVNLTATPDSGMAFAGWSGACTGTGACSVSLESSRLVTATFAFADAVAAEAEMTYYGQSLTVIDPATTRASASPAMYMAVFPQAAPAGMVLRGVQGSEAYTGNAGLTRLITWLLTQGCDGGSPCAMVYAAVYAADGSHTDVTFSPVAPADRLYLPAVSRP